MEVMVWGGGGNGGVLVEGKVVVAGSVAIVRGGEGRGGEAACLINIIL